MIRRTSIAGTSLAFVGALCACLGFGHRAVAADSRPAQATAAAQAAPAWFARIGDTIIPADEYMNTVRTAYRNKYYHGKPPDGEVEALLRNTGQELIDQVLLKDAARQRKIEPDAKDVQAQIDAYEQRYGKSPSWPQMREQALPPLRKHLEGKSVLTVLERTVRTVAEPTESEVRAYYDANLKLFTEPEKNKVSLILLRVNPASTKEEWAAALAEGEKIVAELKAGADFAAMARKRSNDPSADNGGDLGYLHTGMLPDIFQEKVNDMQPGAISEALRALEGILIYRLDDRIQPALRPFDAVKERASGLLKRELSEKAWKTFMADLRAKAKVEIAPEFQKNMAPPAEPTPAKTADVAAPVKN